LTEDDKMTYAMSRRRRRAIIAACAVAAAAVVLVDHVAVRQMARHQSRVAKSSDGRDFARYHAGSFTVVKVVDGDTIDIDARDGKYEHTRIRLWGVDTPETKSTKYGVMYFGPQAADFAREMVLGKQVTVFLDEDNRTRGKYGRLLAYVQLPDKRFLNEVLLSEGFAYADLRFKHSLYHKYEQFDASARSRKKGLWAGVTREQLPEWLRKRKPKLLLKKGQRSEVLW